MSEYGTSFTHNRPQIKTVLLVEDDADIREVVVYVLESETLYHVIVATDSFQALKLLNRMTPDLILLDHLLPGMSRLALYEQPQTRAQWKSIPTIFMSANLPTGELRERQVSSLRKPFELEDLLQMVEKLLEE